MIYSIFMEKNLPERPADLCKYPGIRQSPHSVQTWLESLAGNATPDGKAVPSIMLPSVLLTAVDRSVAASQDNVQYIEYAGTPPKLNTERGIHLMLQPNSVVYFSGGRAYVVGDNLIKQFNEACTAAAEQEKCERLMALLRCGREDMEVVLREAGSPDLALRAANWLAYAQQKSPVGLPSLGRVELLSLGIQLPQAKGEDRKRIMSAIRAILALSGD